MQQTFDEMKARIIGFANLKANWNSYGGEPMHQSVIDSALEGLHLCRLHNQLPTTVNPTGEPSIIIEIHRQGLLLLIEFYGDVIVILRRDSNGPVATESSFRELAEILQNVDFRLP